MAKSMFANLNAIVGNTLTESIKMIDISELHSSPDNFFQLERVDEFAETILGQGGVKDNLLVRPLETGGYEIISGHRRRAAVQMLIDRGENISHLLPCLVQEYSDDDDRMLDLVLMNISTRRLSDSELWQSYETISEILTKKKEAGQKFGKLREALAEYLSCSPAQVGKMQNVEKNAIDGVKEAIRNDELSISTANEIAKLDEEAQEELVKSKDLSNVKHKDIKQQVSKSKAKSEKNSEEKVDTYINYSDDDAEIDEFTVEETEDTVPEVSEVQDAEQEIHKTEETIKTLGQYIMDNHEDISELLETCKEKGISKPIVNELLKLINDNFFSEKVKSEDNIEMQLEGQVSFDEIS
jgi:ParB family chromosome partitioning protein